MVARIYKQVLVVFISSLCKVRVNSRILLWLILGIFQSILLKQPYRTVEQSQIPQKKPTNGALRLFRVGFFKNVTQRLYTQHENFNQEKEIIQQGTTFTGPYKGMGYQKGFKHWIPDGLTKALELEELRPQRDAFFRVCACWRPGILKLQRS